MGSIDYKYKSSILKTDLCKRVNAIDRQTYLNAINGIVKDEKLDNEYFYLLLENDYKDVKEARKINNASYLNVLLLNN